MKTSHFFQQWHSEKKRTLICTFLSCFKTKKIVCILVILVMSNIYECQKSWYTHPYFSAMTFQDIEDFNKYSSLLFLKKIIDCILVFLVILNFFKCQKSQISRPDLPVYSHPNFTYSFSTLNIIFIPTWHWSETKIRSNRFSFINLIARAGPPCQRHHSCVT